MTYELRVGTMSDHPFLPLWLPPTRPVDLSCAATPVPRLSPWCSGPGNSRRCDKFWTEHPVGGAAPEATSFPAVTGERLLLVEDDERIGSSLLRALESSGYTTRWVTTGRQALALAHTHRWDLVLLDLGLPDIDGLEVCRGFRGAHRRPPM